MKMGEVDGKKIGCTVSLLVSNYSSLPPCILMFDSQNRSVCSQKYCFDCF